MQSINQTEFCLKSQIPEGNTFNRQQNPLRHDMNVALYLKRLQKRYEANDIMTQNCVIQMHSSKCKAYFEIGRKPHS